MPAFTAKPESCDVAELMRMALAGSDVEFQNVAEICEDQDIAQTFYFALKARRNQLDGWLGFLIERHPVLEGKVSTSRDHRMEQR